MFQIKMQLAVDRDTIILVSMCVCVCVKVKVNSVAFFGSAFCLNCTFLSSEVGWWRGGGGGKLLQMFQKFITK